jgi:hypothetical protein
LKNKSLLLFLILNLLPQFSVFAQQTEWVKQLAGKNCKISPISLLPYDSDRSILLFKADNNFFVGRKEIKISDTSAVLGIIFDAQGNFNEADSITEFISKQVPSISGNQWILKTKERNGNFFLAYGLNSPIKLPVGLSWNLAYLDGLGHRLWEKQLLEKQHINEIKLLNDGKCLLVGSETSFSGNRNIWISVWNEYGKEIWQKSIGGKSEDMALASTFDADGNIFVSGYFSPDSTFLGNTNDLSGREKDGFIACFTNSGVERFFYRQRGTGFNAVNFLCLQALGKVYFVSTVQGKDWRLAPYGFPKIGTQDLVIGLVDPKQEKENEMPLRVFPNPAKELVYFGLERKFSKGKLIASLHQKNGPVLQQMQIGNEPGSSYKFNVSNTKPGAYFITLKGKAKEISSKVVVE